MFNEAFEKDSSSDDDVICEEFEVDKSYIQRLEVRISAVSFYCNFQSFVTKSVS